MVGGDGRRMLGVVASKEQILELYNEGRNRSKRTEFADVHKASISLPNLYNTAQRMGGWNQVYCTV